MTTALDRPLQADFDERPPEEGMNLPCSEVPSGIPSRYEVLSQVGIGGMGMVYKVRDLETQEIVALKILKPAIAADPEMQESLRREVCVARKVTHKNVCRIYEFNRSNGTACISMEFVEGESLLTRLRRLGALSVDEARDIARHICAGLREAHVQGVVHRDLKPANIMVDTNGGVKIMDFGIARLLQNTGKMTGTLAGTPAYMAPEQLELRAVGARADIYALGLLLYEMVTGTPAFDGDTPIAVALKQIREFPKRPREINSAVPAHTEAIILKCLQKDPENRFQSIDELEAALENRAEAKSTAPRWHSGVSALRNVAFETNQFLRSSFEAARSVVVPWWHLVMPELQRAALRLDRLLQSAFGKADAFMRQQDWKALARSRTTRTVAAVLGLAFLVTSVMTFALGSSRRNRVMGSSVSVAPVPAATPSFASADPDAGRQGIVSGPVALVPVVNDRPADQESDAAADSALPAETTSSSVAEAPAPAPAKRKNSRPSQADTRSKRSTLAPASATAAATEPAIEPSKAEAVLSLPTRDLTAAPSLTPAAPPAEIKSETKTADPKPDQPIFFLEVGSFKDSTWADNAVEKLTHLGYHAVSVHKTVLWMQSYRVQVGPYTDPKEMETARQNLALQGFKSHLVK